MCEVFMSIDTYVIYKRVSLGEDTFAWQIEKNRKVFLDTSYRSSLKIDAFATQVAIMSVTRGAIKDSDKLTTLSAPVFIPCNGYIDEPISREELLEFWKVYVCSPCRRIII